MTRSHALPDADAFVALSLEAQLEALDRALATADPGELLERCAVLRDHAPLAWLARRLLERGWIAGPDVAPGLVGAGPDAGEVDPGAFGATRTWFAGFLLELPDTAIHHVLRELAATAPTAVEPVDPTAASSATLATGGVPARHVGRAAASIRDDLRGLLLQALPRIPLHRLSALCLVDRLLKHHFPQDWEQYVDATTDRCIDLLRRGGPEALPLEVLVQVPASRLDRLLAAASAAGCLPGLNDRRRALARAAIDLLGDAPKAVSQANAEELLARRVYTDPGHFLIELLQNAEDAGATTWRVRFEPAAVVVWHDGLPFDARDLVGVTSIGQTTKRRQQIGFFGVGFKSVYEVTARPRIYSDVFRFEIADISIPRPLGGLPEGIASSGTTLVLPLRDPSDRLRSPRVLFDRARALDPCVLLTLRSIARIELELIDGPSSQRHVLARQPAAEDGVAVLRIEPGSTRGYRIESAELRFDAGPREPERPDRTRVMVGIAVDDDGTPAPLPADAATLYSYLPTEERSGLRFFVQGHFDVPVDRERIAPESAWNRWILEQVPDLLARAVARLAASGADRPDWLKGLLDVLPLERELPAPLLHRIPAALPDLLRAIPFLPGADGGLHTPAETWIAASPAIAALFGHQPLYVRAPDGGLSPRFLLDPSLDARAVEVARSLGCEALTVDRVVDLLEEMSFQKYDEAYAQTYVDSAPDFLRKPTAAGLDALYDLLLEETEHLERTDPPALIPWLNRLCRLPLLLDEDGRLWPASAPVPAASPAAPVCDVAPAVHAGPLSRTTPPFRAAPPFRAIYHGLCTFVDPRLDERTGATPSAHVTAFLDRLGVPTLGLERLVADLATALADLPVPLENPESTPFPGSAARLGLILEQLAEATPRLLEEAGRLPLFRATDGRYWPAAREAGDLHGVLAVAGNVTDHVLCTFYGSARPIGDPEDLAGARVLERLRAPRLRVDTLVYDLGRAGALFPIDLEGLRRIHVLLETIREELSPRNRKLLVLLPIWPDRRGSPRALQGPRPVYLPALEPVCALFPDAPFLDPEVAARAHVADTGCQPVGIDAVLHAFSDEAPPRLRMSPDALEADPGRLEALHRFLIDVAPTLSRATVRECLALPIFPDRRGRLARLGDPRRERGDDLVLPCEPDIAEALDPSGLRLLDPEAQRRLTPLLEAAAIPPAGIELLLEVVISLPLVPAGQPLRGLQRPESLARIRALLVEKRAALLATQPILARPGLPPASPMLSVLPIWRTVEGSIVTADELADVRPLFPLLEPGTPERRAADAAHIEEGWAELEALHPLLAPRPARELLAELIVDRAREGLSLAEQPVFLSDLARVAAVLEALFAKKEPLETLPEPPLVDAAGRLRFAPLRLVDTETAALLEGLPLHRDLLHPELVLPSSLRRRLDRLAASEVLEALEAGPLDPGRRARFYRWLVTHEREVFADAACRDRLASAALFPTRKGRLVPARDLVFEVDLPDLGIDWLPADEIPADTRERLARNLGSDRPDLEALIARPLLPAYHRAVREGDAEGAGRILGWIAARLAGRPEREIQALLRPATSSTPDASRVEIPFGAAFGRSGDEGPHELYLEDATGAFLPPEALLLPSAEAAPLVQAIWGDDAPTPSPARYPEAMHGFLLALGVRTLPAPDRVREAMRRPGLDAQASLALASLLSLLHRRRIPIDPALPLRDAAWVADGTGCPRRPTELFAVDPEVEALIGDPADFPALYPHPGLSGRIDPALGPQLGFRGAAEVALEDVVRHIDLCIARGVRLPFRVYQWLEAGLSAGRIPADRLLEQLSGRAWIYCDDGEFFSPRKVIGASALTLFGRFRGYWERGRRDCPALCALFGIPDRAGVEEIAGFLEELGLRVAREGDRALLGREPALPRMLLACYARLGREQATFDPDLPVILSRTPTAGAAPAFQLLPARAPGLFRSNTPTLEALFARIGRFSLAEPGPPEDREDIDRCYEALGIPRLRDAFQVRVESRPDADRTADRIDDIQDLRGVLRAMLAVLPRVQAQRVQLASSGWTWVDRLWPLASSASIRAVEALKVRYALEGVGEVRVEASAVFDPARGALLVDTEVFDAPDQHTTGLAAGLLPCIYDGPDEETLLDILEILLPLSTADRMNAYLDRRHFPAAPAARGALEHLAGRVGELLDYGLDRRLARRFPELAKRPFERWRSLDLRRLVGEGGAEARAAIPALARRAAPLLLDALEVTTPSPALVQALTAVLAAPSLEEVPADVFGFEAGDLDGRAVPDSFRGRNADASGSSLAALAGRRIAPGFGPDGGPGAGPGDGAGGVAWGDLGLRPGDGHDPASFAGGTTSAGWSLGALGSRLRERFSRWTGIGAVAAPDASALELPTWVDGNCFAPADRVASNVWATGDTLRAIAAREPPTRLRFEPGRLPPPWAYAVHALGITFDPRTQGWYGAAPWSRSLYGGSPTGRTVRFQGRLLPGSSQLPVPLYGRIRQVEVIDGPPGALERISSPPDLWRVLVRAPAGVAVRYEVELLEPPVLSQDRSFVDPSDATLGPLLAPVVPRGRLPLKVRRWLEQVEREAGTPLERALAVQAFVQRSYRYDPDFKVRPEVRHRLATLEPGAGIHCLSLLHATAEGEVLGRGICYELNTLVVELLRHLAVPAAVATGWVLDEGAVDRPDHLFAFALVPSADGLSPLPLDAAVGLEGPRRPLGSRRPAGSPGTPASMPAVPLAGGVWSLAPTTAPDDGDVARRLASVRASEHARLEAEAALLHRAIRLACEVLEQPEPAALAGLVAPGTSLAPVERVRLLRMEAERLLQSPERVGALIRLLRGEFHQMAYVPAEVQELVRLGLARVVSTPLYEAQPIHPESPSPED